ncbi:MAG: hypothetical protein V3W18_04410, partial [candidate division Zixibacteria bacterium]
MRIAKAVFKKAILILISISIVGAGAVKAQNVEYVGSALWNFCQGIEIRDNYAYCLYESGLQILDISNPENITLVGQLHIQNCDLADISVSGNYAYISVWSTDLTIVDISDVGNPLLVSNLNLGYHTGNIFASGDFAYLAGRDGDNNIQILDVSDPENPVVEGILDTPGIGWDIWVSEGYAYVADGGSGLQIVDVSNPDNPVLLGNCQTGGSCGNIFVSGSFAYIFDSNLGFGIIDISDPWDPFIVGNYTDLSMPTKVFVSGNYAYVAEWGLGLGGGMKIFDISDPTDPQIAGNYTDLGILSKSICIKENHAYIANEWDGVRVFDISDPAEPIPTSGYYSAKTVYKIFTGQNYAYVADWYVGLHILDISDLSNPTLVSTYSLGDYGFSDVIVNDGYAFTIEP